LGSYENLVRERSNIKKNKSHKERDDKRYDDVGNKASLQLKSQYKYFVHKVSNIDAAF